MTIYVDNARIPASVGGLTARWSHLTADTVAELHAFASGIGLRRAWFQRSCKSTRGGCSPPGTPCPHWHYDVTESKRTEAIARGAVPVDLRRMGEIIRARRGRA